MTGNAHAAGRDVTLMWDESIDAPYLESYKVYYYTTSQESESLAKANYAVSYTLAGGNPISIDPLTAPKPITIDKSHTQITLHLPNENTIYYFVVTAVDQRGLESVPTPEIAAVPQSAAEAKNVATSAVPVYLRGTVTQGNIPGLSVMVTDGTGAMIAVCDVAADGTWTSPLLPAGRYDWYLAYGNIISAINATIFDTSGLRTISGTITGLPAEGGALSVKTVSGKLQKTVAVGADGAYAINQLVPASDYVVAVTAQGVPVTYYDGRTDITLASHVDVSDADAGNIHIKLTVPDGHISGAIVDAFGTVAGLAVYAYEVETSAMMYTTVNAAGTYDLKVPAGSYQVFAVKANGKIFYFHREDGTPTQNEAYALIRTVTASGQTVGHTDINITEGTSFVEGYVTYGTASGTPVANAFVTASTATEQSTGLTDQNGRYVLSGLKSGMTYTVTMKPLSGNYPVQTSSITAGVDMKKDFIIGIGAALSGTVTAKADAARRVSDAVICLKDRTTGRLTGSRIYYTATDGSYSIHDIAAGDYVLEVFHTDYRPYSANLTVGVSDVNSDIRMETGGSFRGTVRDGSGYPVAGVTVTAFRTGEASVYTTTSSDGSYVLAGLDETKGDYSLTAQKKPYIRQTIAGRQPGLTGTSVDFRLSRPAVTFQVTGVVRTNDNTPVKDATVVVVSKSLHFNASDVTAGDGAYAVDGLIHGVDYTINVLPHGNLPIQSGSFTVNNADAEMNFTIPPGSEIGGYVFGDPAIPVEKDVYIFLYKGMQYCGYTKARSGAFRFWGLAAGTDYKIVAQAEGYIDRWYNGQGFLATADTLATGNTAVTVTLGK